MRTLPERVTGTDRLFPPNTRARLPHYRALLLGLGFIGLCVTGILVSESRTAVGLWSIGLMLVLLLLSVPVAISLAVPSLLGVFSVSGTPAVISVVSVAPFNAVSSWTMAVLPMFIFMGMLLTTSGITARIYRAAGRWFNWLPGGIGIGTTAAGAGLASVSGSTIGMTYALGRAGIPEMLRAGFNKRVAVGAVIVSGLPGGVIPPSILLVVYAGIASVPVGPQLMAGALPGVLIAVLFGTFILVLGLVAPRLVGRDKDGKSIHGGVITWKQRFQSLGEIWSLPVIVAVLFGGMFSGLFTPTEAGAGAALCALFFAIFYTRNDRPLSRIMETATSTVSATAAIFFILIGAEMLTRLLALTGLAQIMTDFVVGLGLSRVGFLLVLIALYIFMGMFFDTLSMMLLTIPILLPTLELMGINPLWFGVFVVFLGELAMITPPVGILAYIVHGIAQDPKVNLGQTISLRDVFIAVAWFMPIAVLFLIIMIAVPSLVEWLPSMMK